VSEEQIRLEAMKIVWQWAAQTDRQPEPPKVLLAYANFIVAYVKGAQDA